MTDEPNPNAGADKNSGDGAKDKTGGNADKPTTRTLTQSELDTMFEDRAKQAERSTISKILEKSGSKTIDELYADLAEGRKLKAGQLSEVDKLKSDLKAAQEKAADAEKKQLEAITKATERLMKAEIIGEAANQGFRPEAISDVWLIVDKTKITEKDGEFAGIKEAVAQVVKAKPFWLKPEDKKNLGTPRPDGKKQSDDKTLEPPRPIKF